jgi:hypothetical protein
MTRDVAPISALALHIIHQLLQDADGRHQAGPLHGGAVAQGRLDIAGRGRRRLAVRAAFPTPDAVATASNTALCALRVGTLPSNAKLASLQELAATSIGLKDLARQRSLAFEQEQLIVKLRLIQDHLAKLDAEIERIIACAAPQPPTWAPPAACAAPPTA